MNKDKPTRIAILEDGITIVNFNLCSKNENAFGVSKKTFLGKGQIKSHLDDPNPKHPRPMFYFWITI